MSRFTKENSDPELDESYFVRCACYGHLTNVSAFVDDFGKGDGFVYLTSYNTDPRYSWGARIKEAWRILRSGLGGGSEIVLSAEEAAELGQKLVELGEKLKSKE